MGGGTTTPRSMPVGLGARPAVLSTNATAAAADKLAALTAQLHHHLRGELDKTTREGLVREHTATTDVLAALAAVGKTDGRHVDRAKDNAAFFMKALHLWDAIAPFRGEVEVAPPPTPPPTHLPIPDAGATTAPRPFPVRCERHGDDRDVSEVTALPSPRAAVAPAVRRAAMSEAKRPGSPEPEKLSTSASPPPSASAPPGFEPVLPPFLPETVAMLFKIGLKISECPHEAKYRSLRTGYPKFRQQVWIHPHARQLMMMAGWVVHAANADGPERIVLPAECSSELLLERLRDHPSPSVDPHTRPGVPGHPGPTRATGL